MRKQKKLHKSWKHLESVINLDNYITKDATTVTEAWVEFTKAYKDESGKEFKVGEIVGIDADDAKFLIKKGYCKDSKKPDTETLLKGITESFEKNIVDKVTETVGDIIKKANNRISEQKFSFGNFAQPKNEKALYGFDDMDQFLRAVNDACRPNGRLAEKFFKGQGEELFGSYENYMTKGTPSGHNSIIDDEGAILIPDVVSEGIWEYAFPEEEILPQTDQRQTSGNSLKFKTVPQTSRKDGYRHAGALAYWMAEADAYTSSMVKWGEERLELHKLGALMYCTQEELDDAAVALAPQFDRRAGDAIRWSVNKSFFLGTGVGQPKGIIRSEAMQTVTAQAAEISASGTIGHYDITAMYHRMLPDLRAGAEWLVHPNLYEQLEYISFKDQTTTPIPIFLPPTGLVSAPFGTLKGRPVRPFEFCSDTGIINDIVFVNWGMYVTLTKAGKRKIQSASSMHIRFLYDEMAYKFTFRIDGMSMLPSGIEDYNGSTKRGPFVNLSTRRSEGTSSGL